MGLGKFESVDIRSEWKNEEYDFTPWLALEENIQILADELMLELDVEGIEVPIGSFKADILAADGEGRKVIIENQLNKTDHKHLGQLITYASGIEAKIVVWVCAQVTDEHRQAVDWLNDVTKADVAFFACEVELWRIDDSKPAPRFKVVSSPNNWSKTIKAGPTSETLSPTKSAHLAFWNGFKEYMTQTSSQLKLRMPRAQHWYTFAVGRSKFHISLTTNTQSQRIGCELYIRGEQAKAAFSALQEDKPAIEAALGPLEWQELPEGQDCRIIQYRDGNSKDEAQWPELFEWLGERTEVFYAQFSSRVKKLELG